MYFSEGNNVFSNPDCFSIPSSKYIIFCPTFHIWLPLNLHVPEVLVTFAAYIKQIFFNILGLHSFFFKVLSQIFNANFLVKCN